MENKRELSWYGAFAERKHLRDYITLLHLPFTTVLLSVVVIGASFSPVLYLDRLLWSLVGIFLALGIAAHYFDEIKGRPWKTKIPEWQLWLIAILGFFGAILIGIYLILKVSLWLSIFVFLGFFFVFSYNLELFDGLFHRPKWFATAWSLVFLGSYFLHSLKITLPSLIMTAGIWAFCLSVIVLYEATKKETTNQLAWGILKIEILMINLIAISLLLNKLL